VSVAGHGSSARRVTIAALPVVLTACSLLTSLDGLTGGDVPDGGAGATDSAVDASSPVVDGATSADASSPSDPRFAAYGKAVLDDNPLAYWRLEETADSVAKDERGLHDATYRNDPVLGEPGIVGGRAMRMPAGKHAHFTQDAPLFRFAGVQKYTVELWAKLDSQQPYQWLGGTEGPVNPRSGWSLFVDDVGTSSYEVWGPPLTDGGSPLRRALYQKAAPVVKGRFAHIVMVFDDLGVNLWLDGVSRAGESTTVAAPDTGTLMFGCRRTPTDITACVEDGVLDEVALYDHPLSAARIVAHYQLGKP
jgi:hypothetical protein